MEDLPKVKLLQIKDRVAYFEGGYHLDIPIGINVGWQEEQHGWPACYTLGFPVDDGKTCSLGCVPNQMELSAVSDRLTWLMRSHYRHTHRDRSDMDAMRQESMQIHAPLPYTKEPRGVGASTT